MTETGQREGGWMKVTFFGYLPEGAELFSARESAYLDVTSDLMKAFGFIGLAHLTVSRGKAYQDAAAGADRIRAGMQAGECIVPQRQSGAREVLDRMAREGQAAGLYEATEGPPPRRGDRESQ